MELLRPGEVAMLANHLARFPDSMQRAEDVTSIWNSISRHIRNLIVDCEAHTLSIMLNAYAVAKRIDDEVVIEALCNLIPSRVRDMNARTCCMVINAFARLKVNHPVALEALIRQAESIAPTFNAIDVATFANGLAKIEHPNSKDLVKMLPLKQNIHNFSASHIAMVANALARIGHRDEELLRMIAERANVLTNNGTKPFPTHFLASTVHAMAMRLNFAPLPLVRTVVCTLPKAADEFTIADVVLIAPVLAKASLLKTMDKEWSIPIVQRVKRDMRKFRGNAFCGILYSFAKIEIADLDFWSHALEYLCDVCLRKEDLWTMERYASLSLVMSREVAESPSGSRFFDTLSETCESHTWTPRAVANQALAYAKHDIMDAPIFDFFAATAVKSLRKGDEWKPIDCAQLLWAIGRFDLHYPELFSTFDDYIASRKDDFTEKSFDIIFTTFARLEVEPQRLEEEFLEFKLTKGKSPRLLLSEEVMAG